jgi:hypothetical protein
MKRTIRKDIRWNEDEIERIDAAREEQDFSEFVRDAAMDKVIEYESINPQE